VDSHSVPKDDRDAEDDDDFEVTDAEREADRDLAIQVAAAAHTGAATLAGTVPGAAAAMFQPIAEAIMTAAVQRLLNSSRVSPNCGCQDSSLLVR
jgi:hypothetical protein